MPARGMRAGSGAGRAWMALAFGLLFGGCGPSYQSLRLDGQKAMVAGDYRQARLYFQEAEEKARRRADNLHDLGVCSLMIAKEKFEEYNYPAARREVDNALRYYHAAINELPGYQPALEGKNIALEMKGRFDEALKHAEWAVTFVGPSARQYLFLAAEFEERGDLDAALMAYRQAVAVEPSSAEAHRRLGQFLSRRGLARQAHVHLETADRLESSARSRSVFRDRRASLPDASAGVLGSP